MNHSHRTRLGHIVRAAPWLALGVISGSVAGARFPAGPVHATGLHGYCEYNVCTGTRCRPSGRVRSNCDLTGRISCTNYPCPPERPFSELVDFTDPESGRMLVESGPDGLRALVERIRAGQPYPRINLALATLGEMADRRWMWRDHTGADDWERLRGVASAYLNRSPLSLDAPLRAQTVMAAVTLAVKLRDFSSREQAESLRQQVEQLVSDPEALRARLGGDAALADQVIAHATELLRS